MSDEDDLIGAILRKRSARSSARRATPVQANRSYSAHKSGDPANFPLGLGSFQFAAATASTCVLTGSPQRKGKPRRLTCIAARSGATSTGLLTITDIKIGTKSQMMSGDSIPFDMFAADAVANVLDLADCGPGVDVKVYITISALPTTTDTVDVSAAMLCDVLDAD